MLNKANLPQAKCSRLKIKNQTILIPMIISFVFLLMLQCNENPITALTNNAFAIYFLKDTTLTIKDILNTNLENLKLADKPWLTQDDIEFYDWSSHCIYLKKDKSYFFPNYYEGYYQLPKSWTDRPWIIVANNVPCYQGYFVTDASVDVFPFPEISALEVGTWGYPKDIITSDWPFWSFNSDPRKNELVKDVLVKRDLYHSGIEVFLDTINSPIKIFNDDTTTIEYTIQIKNNDFDNLYIFDPDKVDNEIFHYYNNGPNFFDNSTYESYGSQYKKTEKPDVWDRNWYTLLRSGESIKRTIRLKGYPFLTAGTYLVECGYSAPKQGLEKNIRETSQGRYWIGETRTDKIRISITN